MHDTHNNTAHRSPILGPSPLCLLSQRKNERKWLDDALQSPPQSSSPIQSPVDNCLARDKYSHTIMTRSNMSWISRYYVENVVMFFFGLFTVVYFCAQIPLETSSAWTLEEERTGDSWAYLMVDFDNRKD